MRPQHHLIISFIAGTSYILLTSKTFELPNLMPWLVGGLALDIDHLLTYTAKKRSLNLKKIARLMNEDFRANNQHFYLFHTFEATLFLGYLVSRTNLTWPFLASHFLHLFCDGLRLKKMKKNYSWLKKWTVTYGARALSRFNA